MCAYHIRQHKHKQKRIMQKCPVLHVYIPYTTAQTYTKRFVDKITSRTCIHTLYNNRNTTNTKSHCHISESYMCTILFKKKHTHKCSQSKNAQSYMRTYSIKQHKHKQKHSLPSFPVLHLYISHEKRNINTNPCFQNYLSYMCTYPLQQYKHKHKGTFQKFSGLHVNIPYKNQKA